jgi:HSP20 family protein
MTEDVKTEVAVAKKPRTQLTEFPLASRFTPLDEVERLFDRLMPRSWMRPMTWNWPLWGNNIEEQFQNIRVPQMDVIDRDKEILIRVEVPGVEKKEIDISVTDNALSIKGNTRREVSEEKDDYYRCEISQGNFSRSITLPSGVDSSKISASLKDGVLEVNLPKTEDVQRRSVEIS